MKGLILCGGRGSRLRPLTFSRPKHLLPVMNKPVLYYGIESMIDAGIAELAVIVPPAYRKAFDEALLGGSPWGIHIQLIEQPEPKGLADAVRVAESFIQGDDFLLYLGDNVIDGSLTPLIEKFQTEKLDGLVSVSRVDRPEQFGVVQMNGEKIERVVEKPKVPPSNLAINGVYLFRESIFRAIDNIRPSARGEYELTDAIQQLIDDRYQLGVYHSPYWWKDTGQPRDLILCNQHFLKKLQGATIRGEVDPRSSITAPVVIGENTRISNSIVRGPAIIGNNSIIENAYIGPYTSISNDVTISGCSLENSIIMEDVVLHDIPQRIDESLIGGDSRLAGRPTQPRTMRLWVGDHSYLDFPQ